MHESASGPRAQTVQVILDPSLAHRAPLEAAARLARLFGLTLHVWIVDNPDFEAIASLPFARELRTSSSSWSGLSTADVRSSYAGQLRRVQQLVQEVAARFGLSWRLEQARNRFHELAERSLTDQALVMLDRPPRVPVNQRRRYGQLIAVFDGTEDVLQVAAGLAEAASVLLQILVIADSAATFVERRAQARKILGPHGPPAQWRWQVLPAQTAEACECLSRRLTQEIGTTQSLVILPAGAAVCPSARQLTDLAGATVLLVPRRAMRHHRRVKPRNNRA